MCRESCLMQEQRSAFCVYASADFRKVSPFYGESDRNLSTRLIPQLQQFIVCFPLPCHLHQQPNKSSLPAFVQKRPMRPCCNSGYPGYFSINLQPLGLSIAETWRHITFFIGWKTLSQPPCYRRTAFPVHFQLTSFSLFLPLETRNLQGEKENSL